MKQPMDNLKVARSLTPGPMISADDVRVIRAGFGLGVEAFAELVGVHRGTVRRWEADIVSSDVIPTRIRNILIRTKLFMQNQTHRIPAMRDAVREGLALDGGYGGTYILLGFIVSDALREADLAKHCT